MASLLDDEELVSAPPLTDDDHNLEIQELVVDDLHVVDMLGGHADVVNEVTVLESGSDRPDWPYPGIAPGGGYFYSHRFTWISVCNSVDSSCTQ